MMTRRLLSHALAGVLLLASAACDSNQAAPSAAPAPAAAPAPTPAPAPAPPPAPTVFTVTGTVTESEPTTSRRLDGATVQIGSRTATTDGAGAFTVTDVPAGTYTVQVSKSGWDSATRTLTLPDQAGTRLAIGLDPNFESISREIRETVSADDKADCPGSHGNYKCFAYGFPAHHARGIDARLYWHSSDAKLELEMRCNGTTWVRTEGLTPSLTNLGGETYYHFRILEDAKKNQQCEIRVLHISGDPMPFILQVRHPN